LHGFCNPFKQRPEGTLSTLKNHGRALRNLVKPPNHRPAACLPALNVCGSITKLPQKIIKKVYIKNHEYVVHFIWVNHPMKKTIGRPKGDESLCKEK
jgi:hypothetical protein